MKVSYIWGFLAFIFSTCYLSAQDTGTNPPLRTNTPKYSNEFLRIGIGARAFGMGNAQAAVVDDVTAGYWNPAGLAQQSQLIYPEISLMHASYFADISQYNYIGFTVPVDSGGSRRFGVTLIRMGTDDIPNTLKLVQPDGTIDYSKVESFSETNLAALLSYAWQAGFVEGLSFGANVKIVYRGVGRFGNAWGFGLDVAAQYQRNNFHAGLVVTDATQTYNAWTYNTETFEDDFRKTGNAVYQNSIEITRPAARLGVGYNFKLARKLHLLMAFDNVMYFDGNRVGYIWRGGGVSIDPRLGMELAYLNSQYRKVAFLRGGLYNIQHIVDNNGEDALDIFPTAGVGFVVRNFTLDYALANIGNLSENLHSHIISLKFHIQ